MGQIFNRLERLVRSMTQETGGWGSSYDEYISDADMKEAWEELNSFLDEDKPSTGPAGRDAGSSSGIKHPPESLRKNYEILGVPFGSDITAVRKSYREQLRMHHPDLHAADSQKQQQATDVTRKIILAYRHIRDYYKNDSA